MILSDRDIIQAIDSGEIEIYPFSADLVQSASVDLTLSPAFRTFDKLNVEYLDARAPLDTSTLIEVEQANGFTIYPGDFALGSTRESITLPSHLAARIEGRSSIGRIGVSIQASAGHIAPGFSGNITLEITNVSRTPVKLYAGMRIAQIIIEPLSSSTTRPYGSSGLRSKYQSQQGPTASQVWKDFESAQGSSQAKGKKET